MIDKWYDYSHRSAHPKQGQIIRSIPFFFLLGLLSVRRLLAGRAGGPDGPGGEVGAGGTGTGGVGTGGMSPNVSGVTDTRGVGGISTTFGTRLDDTCECCDPRASSSFCPGRPSSSDFARGLLPRSSSSNEPVPRDSTSC